MTNTEIRRLRKALGVSQAELARRLRVNPLTVSRWERGATPIPYATGELVRLWVRLSKKE
jgi:DNA-binding transcriptional regulator YiaG